MTLDVDPDGIPVDQPDQKESVNPRPAWERIAYTWLEREVDHGQPVDPTELAAEVSVRPGWHVTWCGCCATSPAGPGALRAAGAARAGPDHRRLPAPGTPGRRAP